MQIWQKIKGWGLCTLEKLRVPWQLCLDMEQKDIYSNQPDQYMQQCQFQGQVQHQWTFDGMRTLHDDVYLEASADETFSEVHGGQKEEVEKV